MSGAFLEFSGGIEWRGWDRKMSEYHVGIEAQEYNAELQVNFLKTSIISTHYCLCLSLKYPNLSHLFV